ncbi:MAG: FkbM family methyltransferase, partial [Gammaproteobacteria bacterium]
MRLYTGDVLSHLIYCKGHEYNERQFLSLFLKPGDVFIDVGANSGLYTLLASSIVGDEGKVYAFEPSPLPFVRLEENARLHGGKNIECLNAALSDRERKMKLNISSDGRSAWDSFVSEGQAGQTGTTEVMTTTLDKFVSDKNLMDKITMMKIDVEGWETHVLSGGIKSLAGPEAPMLQIEFTDHVAMPAGMNCRKLYTQVSELGYQLCLYDMKTGRLQPDAPRAKYPNLDLYAVKNLEKANR